MDVESIFSCCFSNAGFDYGRVGMIDARSDKLLGDLVVNH